MEWPTGGPGPFVSSPLTIQKYPILQGQPVTYTETVWASCARNTTCPWTLFCIWMAAKVSRSWHAQGTQPSESRELLQFTAHELPDIHVGSSVEPRHSTFIKHPTRHLIEDPTWNWQSDRSHHSMRGGGDVGNRHIIYIYKAEKPSVCLSVRPSRR